jgi:hypothetical protein
MSDQSKMTSAKEEQARAALQEIGLEIADCWVTSIETRPTQQLVLQKMLDPIVRHILNSIFPWIIGVAILFMILLICTVVTCIIVLRSTGSYGPVEWISLGTLGSLAAAASLAEST